MVNLRKNKKNGLLKAFLRKVGRRKEEEVKGRMLQEKEC